ncbi:MAG: hypothetical protein ACJAYU_003416 [Bradymonadia bacterium]
MTRSAVDPDSDYGSTCVARAEGPNIILLGTAPSAGIYEFDLSNSDYDTVLHTYGCDGTCSGRLGECDDDDGTSSRWPIEEEMRAGEPNLLTIDGYSFGSGAYVLDT